MYKFNDYISKLVSPSPYHAELNECMKSIINGVSKVSTNGSVEIMCTLHHEKVMETLSRLGYGLKLHTTDSGSGVYEVSLDGIEFGTEVSRKEMEVQKKRTILSRIIHGPIQCIDAQKSYEYKIKIEIELDRWESCVEVEGIICLPMFNEYAYYINELKKSSVL